MNLEIHRFVNLQMPKPVTSFPHGKCREKKIGRYTDSAEERYSSKRKKRQNDHWIKPYASHSSFVKSGQMFPTNHKLLSRFTRDEDTAPCMLKEKPLGNDLLSQEVALQVPSALTGLTTGFGMLPGVPPSLQSPRDYFTS